MTRERSNQICVVLENAIIKRLGDETAHTGSSKSSVVAQWINSYFETEHLFQERDTQLHKLRQDLQAVQEERDQLAKEAKKGGDYSQDIQRQSEQIETLKSQLNEKEEELRDLKDLGPELARLRLQVERLQAEATAKDNDIKRLEDDLGYLRHEHSKLREDVAAPLTRLLTAARESTAEEPAEPEAKKSRWRFWSRS